MNDLDKLRPEVRESLERLSDSISDAAYVAPENENGDRTALQAIRTELLRLATIEADALIALDCEHDWQVEHKRAEKAEAELAEAQNTIAAQQGTMGALQRKLALAEGELAALKARIADAPTAVVQGAPGAVKASFHGYACFEYAAENLQSKLRGKRVRLLVEE